MNTFSHSFLSRKLYASWMLAVGLVAIIVFGHTAFAPSAIAQDGFVINNKLMIHGGVNTPVGNFASLPSTLQDFVSQQNKAPIGAANLGFTLGLSDVLKLSPNIGLIVSLDANYNPYNTVEAERQLRAGISNLSINGVNLGLAAALLQTNVSFAAQPYLNGTLMGGLRYELPILAGVFSVYASAQGGVFYGILPQTEAKIAVSVPLVNVKADAVLTQATAQAAALGYGFGAGIVLFDRVNIGARYTAASPDFSTDIKQTVNTTIPGNVSVPGLGQVNIQSLVNAALGLAQPTPTRFAFPVNTVQVTLGVIL